MNGLKKILFILSCPIFFPLLILILYSESINNYSKFLGISLANSSFLGFVCFGITLVVYIFTINEIYSGVQKSQKKKKDILGICLSFIILLLWVALINAFYFCHFNLLIKNNSCHTANSTTLNFEECYYFTIITVSTLGYGDIIPNQSILARFGVISTVLLGILHMVFFVSLFMEKLIKRTNS